MLEINKCYLGDCLDYMKQIPDKYIDLVLTDPPYGINRDVGFTGSGGFRGDKTVKPILRTKYDSKWDSCKPDTIYFDELQRISKNQIIFGGNFYTDYLSVGTHWIVWDKKNTMPTFGDAELCWTSFNKNSIKLYKYTWNGLIQEDMKHKIKRVHPTEKPYPLIEMILRDYSKEGELIFDGFAGSFSVAHACINTGRDFICIEKDEEYFNKGLERVKKAQSQGKLSNWF